MYLSGRGDSDGRGRLKQFYEDLSEGFAFDVGPFCLAADEVTQFARQWDPQPSHRAPTGHEELGPGQSVSGLHSLAATFREFVVAGLFGGNIILGLGYEEVRFLSPVFAGDTLHARAVLDGKRRSKSRPNLGILTWRLATYRAELPVLRLKVVNLIRARECGASNASGSIRHDIKGKELS